MVFPQVEARWKSGHLELYFEASVRFGITEKLIQIDLGNLTFVILLKKLHQ